MKPKKGKYVDTWPVKLAIQELKKMGTNLDRNGWEMKLIGLLKVYGLLRSDDISKIELKSIKFSPNSVFFRMKGTKRQSPEGYTPGTRFKKNQYQNLCIVLAMKEYIGKSQKFRKVREDKDWLFIKRDGTQLSSSQIGEVTSELMKKCNIEGIYKPHSFRHAAASHLLEMGHNIKEVMRLGQWRSLETLRQFYDKSVVNVGEKHFRSMEEPSRLRLTHVFRALPGQQQISSRVCL